jgi:tRNA (guanine37-N1)-methyltransferase
MKIDILTIFPKMFDSYFEEGMIRKAREKKLLDIQIHDIRNFTKDKWGKVDDTPFGGGAGMLMTAQPIYDAVQHLKKNNHGPVIYMSPKGKILTHTRSRSLSKYSEMILICGRYEGIDQRVIDLCVDQEISIGKYVLTGGELAAMVVIDAVARFVPGVLGDENSHIEETFSSALAGKKEYPHYTKPRIFQGLEVPEVLLSGNHAKINQWRKNKLT